MPALTYTGSYGGTDSLNATRTVSLSTSSSISSYRVDNVYANVYLSTNAYSKTYNIAISVYNGNGSEVASGSADCKMDSSNYGGAWFAIQVSPGSGFDPNNISYMTVRDTTDNASKVFLKSNTMVLGIEYTQYSSCTAPTSVSAPSTGVPGGSVVVSWSGASGGTNVSIDRYYIYRSTSPDSGYTYRGQSYSQSFTDSGLPTNATVYYKVATIGSVSGYDSDLSSARSGGTACYYSACSAPTSVSAPGSGTPGGSITVSWSGASGGTNVSISRYQVYRSTSADGSYSAIGYSSGTSYTDSNLPANVTLYYKVKTIASVSGYDSGLSSARSSGTSVYYGACTPPTTITVPSLATPSAGVSISWSGATAGTNVSIASYMVYRSTASAGTYTNIGSTTSRSYRDTNVVGGNTYYYKIQTIANVSGYNSTLSAASSGCKVNAIPTAPTLQASGTIYNTRPRILGTAGTDSDGDTMTIGCSGYGISSASVTSGGKFIARKTTESTGAQTATVSNTDPNAGSASSSVSFAVAVPTWTDDPIIAGTTVLKAAHINEIRAALDNICTYYGIAQTEWEETITAGVTADINWAAHVTEIHETITRIANHVNTWDTASATNRIVLPNLKTAYRPSAAVMNQLREIILLL